MVTMIPATSNGSGPGTDAVDAARELEVPSVSVVVPARDAGQYLAVQLEALAAQSLDESWELVVVDNASADDTGDVARSFISRFPQARIVDAGSRFGPAHARNVGASVARGELLCFVDADDRVAPGWLQAMTSGLAVADAVGGPMIAYVCDRRGRERIIDEGSDHLTTNDLGYLASAPTSNFGVRRAAFEALAGFDESFVTGEDIDLCWRLQLAGYRIQFVEDARVYYQERADLPAVARQFFRYGEAMPKLFSGYRLLGMPSSSPWMATRAWSRVVATAFVAWRSSATRRGWVKFAAQRAGRVSGSFKQRVLYL
jgi:glycosyltransferase involved in cell wall biosynthesis